MAEDFGVGVTWVTAHIHKVCFAAPKTPAPKTRLTKFTKKRVLVVCWAVLVLEWLG